MDTTQAYDPNVRFVHKGKTGTATIEALGKTHIDFTFTAGDGSLVNDWGSMTIDRFEQIVREAA